MYSYGQLSSTVSEKRRPSLCQSRYKLDVGLCAYGGHEAKFQKYMHAFSRDYGNSSFLKERHSQYHKLE